MAFTIKKGDLIYATDGTLGFVANVYRPKDGNPDEGWAEVDVPGLGGPTYIQAHDIATRDETVPSVLLKLTYEQATDEAHRREPEPIARGEARPEETPLLEVGRPELPGTPEDERLGGTPTTDPSRPPRPDAVREWPPTDGPQPSPDNPL